MHKALTHSILCLTLCAGFASTQAHADITITNLEITANGFSLSITGTLPTNTPFQYPNTFTLVNADSSQGLIFGSGGFAHAASATAPANLYLSSIFTGPWSGSDYIVIQGSVNLLPGEALNGTITGTWNGTPFNPEYFTAASQLQLYWGAGPTPDPTTGVFLAAIPEPSTVALLSAGAAAALVLAVRRRRNKA